MSRMHFAVTMSCLMLLVGCATTPNGGYDYKYCRQVPFHADGIPQTDMGGYFLDSIWVLSCATLTTAGNGVYALHRIFVHGDTYHSPDGLFSVELPGRVAVGDSPGLVVGESISVQRDYVAFAPRPTGGTAYGITVLPKLPDRYARMDVVDFSHAAVTDLMDAAHAADKEAPALERLYEQQITLDGRPVMFATFRRQGSEGGPYYLVYFVENGAHAAILSVLWTGDALPSGPDAEAAIRTMDPGLQAFVNSFRLRDN